MNLKVVEEGGKWFVREVSTNKSVGWYWQKDHALSHALNEMNRAYRVLDKDRWKFGILRNKNSWWIGVHYSPHNKRWCINLIPCFTLWITKPGGNTPCST